MAGILPFASVTLSFAVGLAGHGEGTHHRRLPVTSIMRGTSDTVIMRDLAGLADRETVTVRLLAVAGNGVVNHRLRCPVARPLAVIFCQAVPRHTCESSHASEVIFQVSWPLLPTRVARCVHFGLAADDEAVARPQRDGLIVVHRLCWNCLTGRELSWRKRQIAASAGIWFTCVGDQPGTFRRARSLRIMFGQINSSFRAVASNWR